MNSKIKAGLNSMLKVELQILGFSLFAFIGFYFFDGINVAFKIALYLFLLAQVFYLVSSFKFLVSIFSDFVKRE